jgi:hypothetical protein
MYLVSGTARHGSNARLNSASGTVDIGLQGAGVVVGRHGD